MIEKEKVYADPIVTEIVKLEKFCEAEDYHQNYLQKNPGGYTCHAVYFDSYLDS